MKINQEKVQTAIAVIASHTDWVENGFPNALKGDVSSFGASIIQSGILPSVLFFSEKPKGKDETKIRRTYLMQFIYAVVHDRINLEGCHAHSLLDYVRNREISDSIKLDNVTEAALAVKVALRAFHFND